jgi:hypothetical protein
MIYEHIMFDRSSNLRIGEHDANLGYDDGSGVQRTHASGFVYNLNPPQRRNWRYSSPMRILRAVLMGQIPLVTRKFGDHELEELALEWDNQQKTADFLWALAVGDRGELLERHLAAASHYNAIAREKNARIDAALPEIA